MATLFKDQDYRLEMATNIVLSSASTLNIRYEKPDETTGELSATVGGTGNQSALADITAAINDLTGNWEFQLEVVIGGKTYFSSVGNQYIKLTIVDPTP